MYLFHVTHKSLAVVGTLNVSKGLGPQSGTIWQLWELWEVARGGVSRSSGDMLSSFLVTE